MIWGDGSPQKGTVTVGPHMLKTI